MNKGELIEALAVRLGDKRTAAEALEAVLAEIQAAVTRGEKVTITGFGVFEKRVRAARTARNPRTGETVRVKKTSVPAFRPGSTFKETVASGRVPKALKAPAKKAAPSTRGAGTAPARKTAAAAPARTTAKAPARKTAAKAPAKTTKTATSARKTTTKAATKATTKSTGRKATSKSTGKATKAAARR